MLRAFVIGFLKNDPAPQEIDFQGVNVKVSYLQFKKKQGMHISGFSLIIL